MRIFSGILILAFCLALSACAEKQKDDDRLMLLGNWRASHMNVHTVLTLRNNGSWQAEDRVEGRHTRIVEKRGKSTGRWNLESKDRIVFSVETAEEAAMWPAGSMQSFDITSKDAGLMVFKREGGRTLEWRKIRAERPEEGEVLLHQVVNMPPLLVNVARSRLLERQRFLCMEMEFVLSLETPVQIPEEIPPPPPLHPEVREILLFYLSSLEYKDINSFDKVKAQRLHLRQMLNPYFENRLHEIEVRNIIVASSKESFEEFILQYPELRHEFGLTPPEKAPPSPPEAEAEAKAG